MPEPVLDTVVLRVMAFAHPNGIEILLETLNVCLKPYSFLRTQRPARLLKLWGYPILRC